MIAQSAAAMRRPRALYVPVRRTTRQMPALHWQALALRATRYCTAIGSRRLMGTALLSAAVALAIVGCLQGQQDLAPSEAAGNQTIVFRNSAPGYWRPEQVEAFDDQGAEAAGAPWNYPRVVRTLRFLNPMGTTATRTPAQTDKLAYRGEGIASWYGPDFHGGLTANGEHYDMYGISAAHRSMPLPSYARVTNLENGRSIIVRVNNRGPYVHNRIVDLSVGTAKALDFYKKGTARVRVEFVGRAPREGSDDQMLLATLRAGTPAPAPSNVMVASAKVPQPSAEH
jgi:rare lipoprotein A (peptidoglycan hydrolase)